VDFLVDPTHVAGTTFPIHMGEHEDGCCSNGVPYKQYYNIYTEEMKSNNFQSSNFY
jgi:hypothetical protein